MLAEQTAPVVAAYAAHNKLSREELIALIQSVNDAFTKLQVEPKYEPAAAQRKMLTAAEIRRTIQPDYIVCLEDNKRFKSLKRHLAMLNLTPEAYREKWGLPGDYPMVAPNYTIRRSQLAKAAGFGRKSQAGIAASDTPKKRGRPPKAA